MTVRREREGRGGGGRERERSLGAIFHDVVLTLCILYDFNSQTHSSPHALYVTTSISKTFDLHLKAALLEVYTR